MKRAKDIALSVYQSVKSTKFLHMLVKSGVFALMILLSFYVPFFVYVAIAYICLLVVVENDAKSLMHLFFFYPFSFYLNANASLLLEGGIFVLAFIAIFHLIRYVVLVCMKKEKIFIWPFIFFGMFLIYILLPFWRASDIYTFVLLILLVLHRKKLCLREIAILLSLGIIISSLWWLVGVILPTSQLSFVKGHKPRFMALTFNPLLVSSMAMFAVFSLMYLFLKRKTGWEFYPLFIAVSLISHVSGSRIFTLIYISAFVTFIVINSIKHRKKDFVKKGIVPALVLTVCLCAIALIFFEQTKVLLLDPTPSIYAPGKDDPGRIGLWIIALKEWIQNINTILFGAGYMEKYNGILHEHNAFLFFLRGSGLFGTLLIAGLFLSLYYYANGKKWKPKRFDFSYIYLGAVFLYAMVSTVINEFSFTLAIPIATLLFMLGDKDEAEIVHVKSLPAPAHVDLLPAPPEKKIKEEKETIT